MHGRIKKESDMYLSLAESRQFFAKSLEHAEQLILEFESRGAVVPEGTRHRYAWLVDQQKAPDRARDE